MFGFSSIACYWFGRFRLQARVCVHCGLDFGFWCLCGCLECFVFLMIVFNVFGVGCWESFVWDWFGGLIDCLACYTLFVMGLHGFLVLCLWCACGVELGFLLGNTLLLMAWLQGCFDC